MSAEKTAVLRTPAEVVDDDSDVDGPEPFVTKVKKRGGVKRAIAHWLGWLRSRLGSVLFFLALAFAVLLGALFYFQYLPDRAVDAEAARSAVAAATDGTVAVLSYSPETVDNDISTAKSYLTGDFLTYYNDLTQQFVAPAVKQKSVKKTATVVRAAVSELKPDSAVVLVFTNQTTTSADNPEPEMTASGVLVSMTKVDDKWLISEFDPI